MPIEKLPAYKSQDLEDVIDPAKPAIIVVEDNVEILMYLSRELSLSYNIFRATDGQQAVELMQRENIQLVISDIMMPVMDGI